MARQCPLHPQKKTGNDILSSTTSFNSPRERPPQRPRSMLLSSSQATAPLHAR
ncbi:hypothetical protein PILCRDRAFT_826010 [Piloderma croceum F 1598]|uniref:Uncharacterized protein n=1 Tax=Piloderma croceum (strain F 1598) TaxID=765440 RepID=A0A0C3FAM3_PILCF|nr:hypothetical protein PILCRDRAFT_826010 [Piloderma croceum F 1598]